MNVKVLKLIGGVELVAEVISDSAADFVEVSRPLVVHVMRGASGEPSLGFGDFCMTANDTKSVKFYRTAMLCELLDADEAVAQTYMQNVTGLVLPGNGQILHG